ncbi:MAG: SDR family oxidoreductase [Ferruginibacter sp.]|nr:SDR family oxidoreductase [Ferruginibacter sp.]
MNYLITGAGSGIGKAIANLLSLQNHTCFLLGRNKSHLKDTLASLKKGDHQIFIADITNDDMMQNLITNNTTLILDGIIANAGIGGENNFGENDRWQQIINTNLTGTYNTIQYFLPALKKSKNNFKQIIITSSVLARLGVANYSAYCASKAGLLGLMRSMAVEYAPQNILVNAICPGWVNTDMAQLGLQSIADGIGISKEVFYDIAMQSVPLKKMSEPQEIANLVQYLLFQTSITGQAIDINGGAIMNS